MNPGTIASKLLTLLPNPAVAPRRTPRIAGQANITRIASSTENERKARNPLGIHLGEHWAIIGSTGAGKTVFTMRGLLEYIRLHYPGVPRHVLDSTGDPDMPSLVHAPLIVEGNEVPAPLREAAFTQIWTPRNSKIPAAYSAWFNRFNDARKPVVIVIDETASITDGALDDLEALLKQFRKHGGLVVCLSQTISGVPTPLFSQSTHYAQFRIGGERYDLAQSRQYLGIEKEEQRPPTYPHGFFYRRTRSAAPVREYRDYKDFFHERSRLRD